MDGHLNLLQNVSNTVLEILRQKNVQEKEEWKSSDETVSVEKWQLEVMQREVLHFRNGRTSSLLFLLSSARSKNSKEG